MTSLAIISPLLPPLLLLQLLLAVHPCGGLIPPPPPSRTTRPRRFAIVTSSPSPSTLTSTSTSRFAGGGGGGGGFGSSAPRRRPSSKRDEKYDGDGGGMTKVKIEKRGRSSRAADFLEELSSPPPPSSTSSSPRLDRFGLPPPTEEDVFPPLPPDVVRVPVDRPSFDRGGVEVATARHLGVNLDAFDDAGRSVHEEGEGGNRWTLDPRGPTNLPRGRLPLRGGVRIPLVARRR
jgi:hypothetical protein